MPIAEGSNESLLNLQNDWFIAEVYKNGGKGQNFNLRLSIQGGERYSRIDKLTSSLERDVVYDESFPFTEQTRPSKLLHTTISYQWNGSKFAQKLSLKILNAFGFKEFQGHRYNLQTGEVEEFREALLIPNLSYKLFF